MDAEDQGKQLARIIIQEDVDLFEVWVRYCTFGGSAAADEFALFVVGEAELSEVQRDMAALALQDVVGQHRDAQGRIHARELSEDVQDRRD